MLSVVDRVPASGQANRVLVTPEGGGTPYYAVVTRADNPTVDGTPINKALFDSVAYDLTEKLVRFTQTQPTLTRDAAALVTTIWLSDSHTEKYDYIKIGTSGSNAQAAGLIATGLEIDLDLEYLIDSTSASVPVPLYSAITLVGGAAVINDSVTNVQTYVRKITFDGYKIVVEQSYTGGSASTMTGSWYDVRILCRKRRV